VARVTRCARPGFNLGSRQCKAAAFVASFGRKPYDRDGCRARHPGDRPLAVPAASRCRARQHHGQANGAAPNGLITGKDGTAAGSERRALSGSVPPASTVPRIPLRGTRLRRAVDPGPSTGPSGPDGGARPRPNAT
jgi:hypothetical protein